MVAVCVRLHKRLTVSQGDQPQPPVSGIMDEKRQGGEHMRVVDVAHLTKVYGHRLNRVTALNDLSFHIEAGEFVGIMGPSGAGKSTLLNMIATIDQPTSGKLTVAGKELTALRDSEAAAYRREDLGFIFQAFNLVPDLTCLLYTSDAADE